MIIKGWSTTDVAIEDLKAGDQIRVTFGEGSQIARVTHPVKTGKHGQYIKAEKHVAASDKWTKPRPVMPCEIIGKIIQ